LKYINEEKEKDKNRMIEIKEMDIIDGINEENDKNRMIEIKEMDIIDGKISFNEIKN